MDSFIFLAWIGSISFGSILLFAPIAIRINTRFGERNVGFCSGFAVAALIIASSFVKRILVLYISYGLLFGVGASFFSYASISVVKRSFKKKLGLALGWVGAGGSIGTLAIVPAFQALIDSLGWRIGLRVMAGTWVLAALLSLSYNPNIEKEEENIEASRHESQSRIKKMCSRYIECSLWRSPKYTIGMIVISTGFFFGYCVALLHLVSFAKDRNIPVSKASLLFIFIGVCSSVSRIMIGKVIDKKWLTSMQGVQLSVFIIGSSLIPFTQAKEYYHFVIFAIYYGLGNGAFISTHNYFLLTCFGDSRKDALGFGMGGIVSSLPVFIGPPIAGFIADEFNSYVPAFYIIGGIVVVASALPFCLLFGHKERQTTRDMEIQLGLIGARLANTDSFSAIREAFQILLPTPTVSFAKDRNISGSKASLLFIFIGVCSSVSRIMIGKVIDKKWLTSMQGLQLSVFIIGSSLIPFTQAKEYYHFVLFAIFYGLGNGAFISTQNYFLLTCFGDSRKDALGYGMGEVVSSLPVFIGPPIAGKSNKIAFLLMHSKIRQGFIADEFNSYVPAFYIIGGIVVVASALPFCLLFGRKERQTTRDMEIQLGLVGARLANTGSSLLTINIT
ncbi:hypothetical protein QZH41_016924 [Actinostola sp. cb2023]|nr:hypothetical protein QZH41_016924 [Actinostola sp. cb2023]